MSYLDFDYENNSILVCKGDARNKMKIILKNKFVEYSEYNYIMIRIYNEKNTF